MDVELSLGFNLWKKPLSKELNEAGMSKEAFKAIESLPNSVRSEEEVKTLIQKYGHITIGSLIKPPKDLKEFEDRIGKFLYEWKNQFFGLTSEAKKPLKNLESLVAALAIYEKRLKKNTLLSVVTLKTYPFLKWVLEKDVTLLNQDDYLLGVHRDRSGLYLPQKNVIAVRCAAQVVWHLEGIQTPSIEAMKDKLCDSKLPYFQLLEIGRFHNPRTITAWISTVFPVPPEARKQHDSKKIKFFNEMPCIPDIFTAKGISFPRLRFALISITRVLKALNWQLSEIIKTRPITFLTDQVKFYPSQYVIDWIKEAYLSNGSIFES